LLTSVSFPVVTSIDDYAFLNCDSLTSVSFPVATNISHRAFFGGSNNLKVTAPRSALRSAGLCQRCGGRFEELRCILCGKAKDY
jgi:hypothetical protein